MTRAEWEERKRTGVRLGKVGEGDEVVDRVF